MKDKLLNLIEYILDTIFKPFEFISAIIRKDKAYFGIASPSKVFVEKARCFGYGFVLAIQKAKLEECKTAFTPYEIKRKVFAPEYKPIVDIVREFNYVKHEYEWERDFLII